MGVKFTDHQTTSFHFIENHFNDVSDKIDEKINDIQSLGMHIDDIETKPNLNYNVKVFFSD